MFWARWLRLSRPSFRLASAPAFCRALLVGSLRRCSVQLRGSIPRGVFRASVALPGAFIGSLITS